MNFLKIAEFSYLEKHFHNKIILILENLGTDHTLFCAFWGILALHV